MDITEAAENVVRLYATQRLTRALHSQKVCGCRSCVARAKGWVDWAAGDDDGMDQALDTPARAEQTDSSGYGGCLSA